MKIAVLMPENNTRATFFAGEAAREIERMGEVWWNPGTAALTGAALADALAGADIAVTGWGCARMDEDALARADRLRLLVHTGGSVAPFVSEALYARGVRVLSGNEMYAESVAEGTLAYMLTGLRRIPAYAQRMREGGWSREADETEALLGRTVGLVGLGAIARKLVPMLRPLRVDILAYDPFVGDELFASLGIERVDDLGELFSRSRVLSVHLPRTKDTWRIIDRALLERLPPGALLINTARGAVIDEEALTDAIEAGRIRAVLDVFDQEPLPADSRLRRLDGAVLMPHMAGPTRDLRPLITRALLEDARRFLAGEKPRFEIGQAYGMSMTNDWQPPTKEYQ